MKLKTLLHARPELDLAGALRTASSERVVTSSGRFLSMSAISAAEDMK
jgi:hypothetical protein